MDNNSRLLYQNGNREDFDDLKNLPGFKEVLTGASGTTYAPGNGGEQVISFAPISPLGWGLLVEEPWRNQDIPLLPDLQDAALLVAAVLLLSLIVLWFGIQQLLLPLRRLESRAASLAEGDFGSIEKPVGGIPEIRDVQAVLIELAEQVESAQINSPFSSGSSEGSGLGGKVPRSSSGDAPGDQVD
jgi:methyl-accepting chemotaxis protein